MSTAHSGYARGGCETRNSRSERGVDVNRCRNRQTSSRFWMVGGEWLSRELKLTMLEGVK